ncbi:MAG TPA: hypothetical protein VK689_17405, partial [Armatimonadota bacterium]|nr:hypothetical protein [Armatimonadota bacterium]
MSNLREKLLPGPGAMTAARLMAVSVLLLALRTAIALGWRLPLGSPGNPLAVRSTKLCGWLFIGEVPHGWYLRWYPVALLWEYLPALLFGAGLWFWLRSCPPTPRWPRIPPAARPWLGALALLLIAGTLSLACFGGIPHVQDSIAQQFQAQIFAGGRAYAA